MAKFTEFSTSCRAAGLEQLKRVAKTLCMRVLSLA